MRLLRQGFLLFGFGVLGLLLTTEHVLRGREGPAPVEDGPTAADWATAAAGPRPSKAVNRVRVILGVLGVGVALFGGYVVLRDVSPASYRGLAIWLAGAVVLHDFVLAPVLTGLRAASLRVGRRLPIAAVWLVQAGFVVGGVLTLVAVPEIYAKQLGPLNPTVLPGSYGSALLVSWTVIVVVTALAAAAVTFRARRYAMSRAPSRTVSSTP